MITPMVARLVSAAFDREGWFFEIKWDGFRAIAEKNQTGTLLYSRNHRDFTKRFPPIVKAISALKENVILDGEIVALDEKGHARFEWLVNRGPQQGILIYFVFDLLQLGKHDLRHQPLSERKQTLQQLVKGHDRVQYVEHVSTHGKAMFNSAVKLGLEGIIAKDPTSTYHEGPKPTTHWQKIKNQTYERQTKIEFKR